MNGHVRLSLASVAEPTSTSFTRYKILSPIRLLCLFYHTGEVVLDNFMKLSSVNAPGISERVGALYGEI